MGDVLGIDLSNNNSDVNVGQLEVDFVYHKATEGVSFTDRFYKLRGSAIMGRAIRFGAYHYARVHSPARPQVAHFLNVASLRRGMLVPFLDVEAGGNEGATGLQWREWLSEWFHEITTVQNRRCGIYVSPGFADFYEFSKAPWLQSHYLFVAHWGVNKPRIPAPWTKAAVWQYASNQHVKGVAGQCDTDKWLATFDSLTVER